MAEPAPRPNRPLLIKLSVLALALLVGAALVARGYDLKGMLNQTLTHIRDAGPVVFFTAQAVLPSVGFPQSAFSLPAGTLFGPQLGMPLVVLLSLLALVVNMALSYWLASSLLRPVCERLILRLGYKVPQVASGDSTDLIVLLRVAPGLPFPVQNYLLGLARVPFGKFILVSCLVTGPLNTAFVLFGDALLQGKGRIALTSFLVIMALAVGTHLLRKHYIRKQAP
jgi:uncharacterized membrane protein YdjX (TVP38/TMEM64 family)